MNIDHIDHFEDIIFTKDKHQIMKTISNLGMSLRSPAHQNEYGRFSIKYDGKPAVLFGEIDNRFFVSTKSFFNKTPKINFSIEDIEKNHAKSPGQIKTLKNIFNTLQYYSFANHIFQGDFLFSEDELYHKPEDGLYESAWKRYCKPNVIEYDIPQGNFRIGIAVHSAYTYNNSQELVLADADFDVMTFMKSIEDVYFPATTAPIFLSDSIYSLDVKIQQNISEIKDFLDQGNLKVDFVRFINYCIKNVREVNSQEFVLFMTERYNDINYGQCLLKEYKKIDSVLDLHKRMTSFKLSLLNSFDSQRKHEGLVFRNRDSMVKFVDRSVFSYKNFIANDKRKEKTV